MFGKIASAALLGLLLMSAGCTLCCHPYYDCGPVYDGGQCSNVRAGSILTDGDYSIPPQTVRHETTTQDSTPDYQNAPSSAEETEGNMQILSVTDRKVDNRRGMRE
jgi:hypothetical protein